MRDRLQRFMYGRYGVDAFGKFTMGAALALCVVSFFIHHLVISTLIWALLFYSYFRMFSKNIQKRYNENMKYLRLKNRFLDFFKKEKSYMQQRKTHHIYKCPSCKQKIRIPKGKGHICITCPKCKTQFNKKS